MYSFIHSLIAARRFDQATVLNNLFENEFRTLRLSAPWLPRRNRTFMKRVDA